MTETMHHGQLHYTALTAMLLLTKTIDVIVYMKRSAKTRHVMSLTSESKGKHRRPLVDEFSAQYYAKYWYFCTEMTLICMTRRRFVIGLIHRH